MARDEGSSESSSLLTESQSEKKNSELYNIIREKKMSNGQKKGQRKDEVMWLRTTSKFVARMNGCWDSEFDTSIEEIVCLSMNWKDSQSLFAVFEEQRQ